MEWEDGNEYPVIRLDVSSDSHPFYTDVKIRSSGWSCGTFQQKFDSNQTTTNLISTVYFPVWVL